MYGFIVLKHFGETEQLIALNVLNVQIAIFAEGIQPIHGTTIKKSPCFVYKIFVLL